MRFAVIGRTSYLYDAAKLLLKHGHELVFVATCKAASEYTRSAEDFAGLASENNAPFINGLKLYDNIDTIKLAKADIAISMNWAQIIDERITSLFPFGILNAHPGALPRYRGNACPNWAIINGEKECGITIHNMTPGELDSGDIVLQETIEIKENTTIEDIYERLARLIPQMLLSAVEGLASGTLTPRAQSKNSADVLRVYPRLPVDGFIDWNACALDIVRLINASSDPFTGAYTYFNGEKLIIWKADYESYPSPSCAAGGQITNIDKKTGAAAFAARDGMVVAREVSYIDGRRVPPANIMKSMRIRLGMNACDEIYELRKRVQSLQSQLNELIKKADTI